MMLSTWSYLAGGQLDDKDLVSTSTAEDLDCLLKRRFEGIHAPDELRDELSRDLCKHYAALQYWAKHAFTEEEIPLNEVALHQVWMDSFPDFGRVVGGVPSDNEREYAQPPSGSSMKHALLGLKVLDSVTDAFREEEDQQYYRGSGHQATVLQQWAEKCKPAGRDLSQARTAAEDQTASIMDFQQLLDGHLKHTSGTIIYPDEQESQDSVSNGLVLTFDSINTKSHQLGMVCNIVRLSTFLRFWLKVDRISLRRRLYSV
jgi:hypothetical protein